MEKAVKSRVGSAPISFGSLRVNKENNMVQISNDNETLSLQIDPSFRVEEREKALYITPMGELDKRTKALWGTYTRVLQNYVKGLNTPYVKELMLVGYRVQNAGDKLVFKIGFSHDVIISIPKEIKVTVKGTMITLSCSNKDTLGGFVKHITDQKKYNPYSGNGILQRGKTYIKKAVKKK